jgi:hypothetical protein
MYWLSSKWRCGRPERGLSSSRNAVRPFICLTVRQEEIGISSIESMCKPPASCYAGQVLAFQSPVSIQTSRRVPERLNYEVHVAQRSALFFLGLLVCERVFALKCGLKVRVAVTRIVRTIVLGIAVVIMSRVTAKTEKYAFI